MARLLKLKARLLKLVPWLLDWWFAPAQPARLRLFEKAFAITFMLYMGAWLHGAREWLTTDGFHYPLALSDLAFSMPLPPLPPWALWPFVAILLGAPFCVVLGRWRRPALLVTLLCAFYVQRVDTYSAFTINKLYLVGFLVLLLAPAPREVAVEGGTALRQSSWPLRVLQATLVIQYGTAGICKMAHGDWLSRFDILIGHSVGLYRTDAAAWLVGVLPTWAWVVQGVVALGFEVLAPVLFVVRRLRPIAYVLGFGMHAVIALMMVDLIWFSLQMVVFYLLFVNGERMERAASWLKKPLRA